MTYVMIIAALAAVAGLALWATSTVTRARRGVGDEAGPADVTDRRPSPSDAGSRTPPGSQADRERHGKP